MVWFLPHKTVLFIYNMYNLVLNDVGNYFAHRSRLVMSFQKALLTLFQINIWTSQGYGILSRSSIVVSRTKSRLIVIFKLLQYVDRCLRIFQGFNECIGRESNPENSPNEPSMLNSANSH